MKGSWEGKVRKAGGLDLPVPLPPPPPTHTRTCGYSLSDDVMYLKLEK